MCTVGMNKSEIQTLYFTLSETDMNGLLQGLYLISGVFPNNTSLELSVFMEMHAQICYTTLR